MTVTTQLQDTNCTIRLEGELTLSTAIELRQALLEQLSSGRRLNLELRDVTAMDIAAIQLLWSVGRGLGETGTCIPVELSEAAAGAVREAGIVRIPGLVFKGDGWLR